MQALYIMRYLTKDTTDTVCIHHNFHHAQHLGQCACISIKSQYNDSFCVSSTYNHNEKYCHLACDLP